MLVSRIRDALMHNRAPCYCADCGGLSPKRSTWRLAVRAQRRHEDREWRREMTRELPDHSFPG